METRIFDGLFWRYYLDDNLTHIQCENNNNIEWIMHYNQGKAHGLFISYYPNKKIKCITLYENGKKHGKYKEFSQDGTMTLCLEYDNDIPYPRCFRDEFWHSELFQLDKKINTDLYFGSLKKFMEQNNFS